MKKLIIILILVSLFGCKKEQQFTYIMPEPFIVHFGYGVKPLNNDSIKITIINNSSGYDSIKWNILNGISFYNDSNFNYILPIDSSHVLKLEGWKNSEYKFYTHTIN